MTTDVDIHPVNMKRSPYHAYVDLMLVRCRRRWANIKSTLIGYLLFARHVGLL